MSVNWKSRQTLFSPSVSLEEYFRNVLPFKTSHTDGLFSYAPLWWESGHWECEDHKITCTSNGSTDNLLINPFLVIHYQNFWQSKIEKSPRRGMFNYRTTLHGRKMQLSKGISIWQSEMCSDRINGNVVFLGFHLPINFYKWECVCQPRVSEESLHLHFDHHAELCTLSGHKKREDQSITCTSTGSTGNRLIFAYLVTCNSTRF